MSTEWMKFKKMSWPEGSLERHLALNYPGCKTLREAVQEILKFKNQIKDANASQTMELPPNDDAKKDLDFEW